MAVVRRGLLLLLVVLISHLAAASAPAGARDRRRRRDPRPRGRVGRQAGGDPGARHHQLLAQDRPLDPRHGPAAVPGWCGAFVHQAFLRAGLRLSARMIDPDRAYLDAVAGRRHLRRIPIGSVRAGDLLFFAFRPGLRASHIALVRSRPRAGSVATVEGNVSNAVRLDRRGLRYPVLAARVVP